MEENKQVKIIDRASIIHLVSKMWEREMQINGIAVKCRERKHVMHRHAFMVAVRDCTKLTYAEIGRVMRKNHATVIHSLKQHETNMRFDHEYKPVYEAYCIELSAISDMLIEDGDIFYPKDANEMRLRLINMSKRIRGHIVEKKELELKLIKVKRERKYLKDHNVDLLKRNDFLDSELKRLKRLL